MLNRLFKAVYRCVRAVFRGIMGIPVVNIFCLVMISMFIASMIVYPVSEMLEVSESIVIDGIVYIAAYIIAAMIMDNIAARCDISSYFYDSINIHSLDRLHSKYKERNEKNEEDRGKSIQMPEVVSLKKAVVFNFLLNILIFTILITVDLIRIDSILKDILFYGGILGCLALKIFFRKKMAFHVDSCEEDEYFIETIYAFATLGDSRHLWRVAHVGGTMYENVNYNITRSFKKEKVYITLWRPSYIKSKSDILSIKFKSQRWVFLPACIAQIKGFSIKLYRYSDLQISYSSRSCVEKYLVPRDAVTLGTAWRYINKDGSRNRTYASNQSRGIYHVGVIVLSLGDNKPMEIQVSNINCLNECISILGCTDDIPFEKEARDSGTVKICTMGFLRNLIDM